MARWTDLATWRGPTSNKNTGGQTEVRGLVVHIAAGWYEGTISWQKNPDSDVSSHFVVGRNGQLAQVVDTADAAWTQRSGNGEWLSIECEGFVKGDSKNPGGWEKLSDAQIDAIARIFLRCHEVYGVPLQTTTSATGRGLGHHSMGADWGHKECPGQPIIAQKPAIVSRALALKNGDDDMDLTDKLKVTGYTTDQWGVNSLDVGTALSHTYTFARAASDRAKQLQETQNAILAKLAGADTKTILDAINKRASEDAARDAALLAELQDLASGGATADQIVAKLAERLAA